MTISVFSRLLPHGDHWSAKIPEIYMYMLKTLKYTINININNFIVTCRKSSQPMRTYETV